MTAELSRNAFQEVVNSQGKKITISRHSANKNARANGKRG